MIKRIVEDHKLNRWKREIEGLCEEKKVTLQDICKYLDLSYNRDIGFYVKLPKKRRMYIGIGMALDQDIDTINRWIMYYGNKRKLYIKDFSEDLVWIYLIECNLKNKDSNVNYYKEYEKCQKIVLDTYCSIWNERINSNLETTVLDEKLINDSEIYESIDHQGIKKFVLDNIDSFKTAYAKPRLMLEKFKDNILKTNGIASGNVKSDSLISLRGWLDDSMINYLSGSAETVNVINLKTGERNCSVKHIPKSRKSHIALALALGMTKNEIDEYLTLMGYSSLDENDKNDSILIKELDIWENNHPLQRKYKDKYIHGHKDIKISQKEEIQAVNDMLMLRQELREAYKRRKIKFEYMNS